MAALKVTIEGLLKIAEKKPGVPARQELRHGLRIDILAKNNTVHLQISRAKTWPADREFSTTLKHWPWPVPTDMTPDRKEHDGRRYLCASFPVQTRMELAAGYSIKVEMRLNQPGIYVTVYDDQNRIVETEWSDNPRGARFKADELAGKYNIETVPEAVVETVEVRA